MYNGFEREEGASEISLATSYDPLNVESSRFQVRARLDLAVSGIKSKKPWFSMSAIFELQFLSRIPIKRSLVSRFADSDVRLIVWPYFREYLSDVCNRVQIMPPIVLPLSGTEK